MTNKHKSKAKDTPAVEPTAVSESVVERPAEATATPQAEQESETDIIPEVRELTSHIVNGCNEALQVHAIDGPGPGGASHVYCIGGFDYAKNKAVEANGVEPVGQIVIVFQNGAIKEVGTNGVTHEALLAILEDRLKGFQSGPYACAENAEALTAIQTAQAILKGRTERRLKAGVEGTMAIDPKPAEVIPEPTQPATTGGMTTEIVETKHLQVKLVRHERRQHGTPISSYTVVHGPSGGIMGRLVPEAEVPAKPQ